MYKGKVKLLQGFKVTGYEQVIDDRLVLTKEDLLKIEHGASDDYFELNRWPKQYFAVVTDSEGNDPQLYVFNKNNEFSSEGDPSHIGQFDRVDYEYLKKHPSINGVELVGDKDPEEFNLQKHLVAKEGISLIEVATSEGSSVQEIRVVIDGSTLNFNADGKLLVPIDNATIKVVNGKLKAMAESLIEYGKATHVTYDSEGNERVDVLVDDSTVGINGDNKLEVLHDGTIVLNADGLGVNYDDLTIKVNSEGKLSAMPEPLKDGHATKATYDGRYERIDVVHDAKTIILGSEGLEVPLDNHTIKLVNGKLKATPESLVDGVATHAYYDSEDERVDVVYDDETVKVNADNELYVPIDKKTIKVVGGKLKATPESLVDGIATHAYYDSEDERVDVLYDGTLVVDSENKLHVRLHADQSTLLQDADHKLVVNIDNDVLYLNSEGKITARQESVIAGKATKINTDHSIDVLFDDASIKLNSEGKLFAVAEPLKDGVATEVKYLASGEETVNVKFDNDTIVLNSEGKLKAVAKNLNAGEAIFVDSENAINVKYDNDTIVLNSEGKLKAVAKNLKAGKGIFVDSENTINALYDNETIKLNSEGKLQSVFAIDNKTIVINSEGKAETAIGGWKEATSSTQFNYTAGTVGTGLKTTSPWTGFYVPEVGSTITCTVKVVHGGSTLNETVTFTMQDLGDGYITGTDTMHALLESIKFKKSRDYIVFEFDSNCSVGDSFTVESRGAHNVYHKVNGKYLPIDDKTIILNASGELEAVAKDLVAGQAIAIASDSSINVKYDDSTIKLNSEGKLFAVAKDLIAGKAIKISSEGAINVVYDNNTVKLDSEGKLKANFDGLVKDVLVKLDSEGYNSVVTDDKGYINLSYFSTDSETGHKIGIKFTSEGDLTVSLYNVDGDLLNSELVNLPIGGMVIDGEYVKTSEGGYIKLTLKNGRIIQVPLDELVGGLVSIKKEQTITGKKDFTGGLLKNGKQVLSTDNVDNITIKWNAAEGVIEATGLEVEAGEAVEVITSGITSEGTPIKKINVKFDHDTIFLDSEGRLVAGFENISAEGPILKDSEGKISLSYDKKTLVLDSEGKLETQIGGWKELVAEYVFADQSGSVATTNPTTVAWNGDHLPEVGQTITCKVKLGAMAEVTETFIVVDDGDYITGAATTHTYLDKIRFKKDKSVIEYTFDPTMLSMGTFTCKSTGEYNLYHTIKANYIPIDEDTIVIEDGKLKAEIDNLEAGEAIKIDSEGKINVLHDDSLIVNSEGKLHVVAEPLKEGEAIKVDSEGAVNVKYDAKTIVLNSEGNLEVPIDNLTIVLDSEGKMMAVPEPLADGIATEVRYDGRTEVVDVLFDEKTIKLDSEGKLHVVIDNETVVINSEGLIESVPQTLTSVEVDNMWKGLI